MLNGGRLAVDCELCSHLSMCSELKCSGTRVYSAFCKYICQMYPQCEANFERFKFAEIQKLDEIAHTTSKDCWHIPHLQVCEVCTTNNAWVCNWCQGEKGRDIPNVFPVTWKEKRRLKTHGKVKVLEEEGGIGKRIVQC